MIYTHVLNRGGMGVCSPADGLAWPPEQRSEISYPAVQCLSCERSGRICLSDEK